MNKYLLGIGCVVMILNPTFEFGTVVVLHILLGIFFVSQSSLIYTVREGFEK